MLVTVGTPQFERASQRHIGPLSLTYGILMHLRNQQLSAYQRTLTLVLTKGSINEQVEYMYYVVSKFVQTRTCDFFFIFYLCDFLAHLDQRSMWAYIVINLLKHPSVVRKLLAR